jgi:hypothetical protein
MQVDGSSSSADVPVERHQFERLAVNLAVSMLHQRKTPLMRLLVKQRSEQPSITTLSAYRLRHSTALGSDQPPDLLTGQAIRGQKHEPGSFHRTSDRPPSPGPAAPDPPNLHPTPTAPERGWP